MAPTLWPWHDSSPLQRELHDFFGCHQCNPTYSQPEVGAGVRMDGAHRVRTFDETPLAHTPWSAATDPSDSEIDDQIFDAIGAECCPGGSRPRIDHEPPSARPTLKSWLDRHAILGADIVIELLERGLSFFKQVRDRALGLPEPLLRARVFRYGDPFVDPIPFIPREQLDDAHDAPAWASGWSSFGGLYAPGGIGMREFRESTFEPLYLGIFR